MPFVNIQNAFIIFTLSFRSPFTLSFTAGGKWQNGRSSLPPSRTKLSVTDIGKIFNRGNEYLNDSNIVDYNFIEELRDEIDELRIKLYEGGSQFDRADTEEKIHDLESKDPEYMYATMMDKINNGMNEEEKSTMVKQALEYRKQLPHFNLDGVWVGRYGNESGAEKYDLIEITYEGNKLVAKKLTGKNRNIPPGEISFEADLSPSCYSIEATSECLMPVELPPELARKWHGIKHMRFPGRGQVASKEFMEPEWLDGELVMADETHFVFIWSPIKHEIFFARPPQNLLDKLLSSKP